MRKQTIVVSLHQEPGHLYPTFKLSRELQARGHDVRYFAIPDLAPSVRAQGFEVLPWFPELFGEGFLGSDDALGLVEQRRRVTARFKQMSQSLLRGEGAWAELERAAPDLVLVDVSEPLLGLLARRRGLATALLNTSLPQTKDPGIPPLRFGDIYGEDFFSRARAELKWRSFLLSRRVGAVVADAFAMCPRYELARRVAAEAGVPAAELDCETIYQPQRRDVPELVLCPEDFDFPRPERPGRHYVESIELQRTEPDFDFEALAPDKPLVYCALGEQRYRAGDVSRLFERVIAAFAERPEWQLLLSHGRHAAPRAAAFRLPNVRLVQRAPQLAVLRRARAMITHGGLGSVKECVAHGVPMLAFPLAIDQPGNAARVAYHGIGLAGDARRTSTDELRSMLDQLITEPEIAARSARMRERFERFERSQRGADLVERLLGRSSTQAAAAEVGPSTSSPPA